MRLLSIATMCLVAGWAFAGPPARPVPIIPRTNGTVNIRSNAGQSVGQTTKSGPNITFRDNGGRLTGSGYEHGSLLVIRDAKGQYLYTVK